MERNSIHPAVAVPPLNTELMKGKPFETTIGIGQVIKGWDDGVPQMSLGEKAQLTITP
jgi:FKBP-type peptidyl-prolyl cis-trans isomerase